MLNFKKKNRYGKGSYVLVICQKSSFLELSFSDLTDICSVVSVATAQSLNVTIYRWTHFPAPLWKWRYGVALPSRIVVSHCQHKFPLTSFLK